MDFIPRHSEHYSALRVRNFYVANATNGARSNIEVGRFRSPEPLPLQGAFHE